MRFDLERVELMPKDLVPGVLYVSEKYRTAAHLCACGCGSKIRTPLGPAEWSVVETGDGPTLSPSVGNWQQPCRSHYLIVGGKVCWAGSWSEEAVEEGRRREGAERSAHYERLKRVKVGALLRVWKWLKGLFGR